MLPKSFGASLVCPTTLAFSGVNPSASEGHIRCNAVLGSAPFNCSNRNEVFVADCSDIGLSHRDQSLSSARGSHEFKLHAVGIVGLHDGTQIPAPQSLLGKVTFENDSVQLFELHRFIQGMLSQISEQFHQSKRSTR
jgi:hypothetical protein